MSGQGDARAVRVIEQVLDCLEKMAGGVRREIEREPSHLRARAKVDYRTQLVATALQRLCLLCFLLFKKTRWRSP